MKKIYVLLLICCTFYNCSDDSQEATLDTTTAAQFASKPEADPMYDNSYRGIYKGIVTGNISGALYVNILNDNRITAKLLTNDNKTYVLNNIPISDDEGGAGTVFKNFLFENENISLKIKLDESGSNISIPHFDFYSNENSKICLKKETSTSLIKCYTGAFEGNGEEGNVNFTTDGQMQIKGISQELMSSIYTDVNGDITLTNPIDDSFTTDSGGKPNPQYQLNANLHIGDITGVLNRNHFDGFWMINGEKMGQWNANRIL